MYYKIIVSTILLFLSGFFAFSQERNDYSDVLDNPMYLFDVKFNETTENSFRTLHPNPYGSFPKSLRDSVIAQIHSEVLNDSLPLTEYLYYYQKYVNYIAKEDPHVHFHFSFGIKKEGVKFILEKIKVLPIDVLIANDTVLVDRSNDPLFQKGDQILTVNNKPISAFLKYAYKLRYQPFYIMQRNYHFAYAKSYDVKVLRNGHEEVIHTEGFELGKALKTTVSQKASGKIYKDYQAGYFEIPSFLGKYNKKNYGALKSFIAKMKKEDCHHLIIDLRKNGGGNGDDHYTNMLALMSEKDSLKAVKEMNLIVNKASKQTYEFAANAMDGELISFPEDEIFPSIPLDKSLYQGSKMKYYILISEYTASSAASFANMFQNNDIGLLIGEPLAHNALGYGNVDLIPVSNLDEVGMYLSFAEIKEFTRSEDGQVYPDISIPYNMEAYKKGGDPMLEQTLELIKNNEIKNKQNRSL